MFENTKSDMWSVKMPNDKKYFYVIVYLLTVKLKTLLTDSGLSD